MRLELAGSMAPPERILRHTLLPDSVESFAKMEFLSDISELWFSTRIRISARTQRNLAGGPDSAYLVSFWTNDDTQLMSLYFTPVWDNVNLFWRLNDSNQVELLPHELRVLSDKWTDIEIHYADGEDQELYIGGKKVVRYPTGILPDGAVRKIFIGQYGSGGTWNPENTVSFYFEDVKVGPTRGSGTYFGDNFNTPDLTNWTLTAGIVSHIADPFAANA